MNSELNYAAQGNNVSGSSQTADREFSEALDRVYERYGNNLSAFYRDATKSLSIEKSAEPKPKRGGKSD